MNVHVYHVYLFKYHNTAKQFNENCDTLSNNRLTLFGTIPRVHYISSNIKFDIAIAPRLIHLEDHCGLVTPHGVKVLSQQWYT